MAISDYLLSETDPTLGRDKERIFPAKPDTIQGSAPGSAPPPGSSQPGIVMPAYSIPAYTGSAGVQFNPGPAPTFRPPPDFVPPEFNIGNWQADPGYQFRMQQGTDALQQSAAARGLLQTGGTLRDLINYGQNFASQEYGNVFQRNLDTYDRGYRASLDAYNARYKRSQDQYQSRYDPWLARGNWGNTDALAQFNQQYNIWNTLVQAEIAKHLQMNNLVLGA